ncbi:MAG: DUF438 domain-containing protein [Tissierellia bacterium]|nr:DUF438 domain-containing protein [Tissierellia bacterium]
MGKKIDLNKTVYELTKEYPELIDVMKELGFDEITKQVMINSVGRMMTIPKGAKMKKISMLDVVASLKAEGFELVGQMPDFVFSFGEEKQLQEAKTIKDEGKASSRKDQIKGFLLRLSQGEDLESVKKDFVRDFEEVEASEIMQAEQDLLREGTPLSEVQRLCDVHSALFHGATREERIANAEKAVEESMNRKKIEEEIKKRDSYPKKDYSDKDELARKLGAIKGHPLYTLLKENEALDELLKIYDETKDQSLLSKFREVSIHYAKKGDLLYPLLKVKYGVSGPSDVMWTVDDEIRDEMGALEREENKDAKWQDRLDAVLTRAKEMIYKEANILFPICAVNFSNQEWYGIYQDSKDYDMCLGIEKEIWQEAQDYRPQLESSEADEIVMPGGALKVDELRAILNTVPLEITFVDKENINKFFNEGPKLFKRPSMALGREVFSCHPPKIEPMVRQIIDDFRQNRRDKVEVWMEKAGKTMLVTYMAVRDENNNYVGTMEIVQDMEFAKKHFQGK